MFSVAHSLTSSPAALFKATTDVITEFSQDGVVYLELRSTPRQVPRTMTKTQYIQAIIDAILECRQTLNILVKLLVSIDRRQGQKEAEETLDLVFKVNKMHPDIVVGLDLSGDPSQRDFMEFSSVLAEARRYGLKMSIHCAEVGFNYCLSEWSNERLVDYWSLIECNDKTSSLLESYRMQ
uniref:Adenosine deaminase domain-containing protein n=1 Tax=Timema shepardi TaxID=629360 RepID=A0A7R9BBF5_TIMSH|nr:unnamed protein product [Timema shepardi]